MVDKGHVTRASRAKTIGRDRERSRDRNYFFGIGGDDADVTGRVDGGRAGHFQAMLFAVGDAVIEPDGNPFYRVVEARCQFDVTGIDSYDVIGSPIRQAAYVRSATVAIDNCLAGGQVMPIKLNPIRFNDIVIGRIKNLVGSPDPGPNFGIGERQRDVGTDREIAASADPDRPSNWNEIVGIFRERGDIPGGEESAIAQVGLRFLIDESEGRAASDRRVVLCPGSASRDAESRAIGMRVKIDRACLDIDIFGVGPSCLNELIVRVAAADAQIPIGIGEGPGTGNQQRIAFGFQSEFVTDCHRYAISDERRGGQIDPIEPHGGGQPESKTAAVAPRSAATGSQVGGAGRATGSVVRIAGGNAG